MFRLKGFPMISTPMFFPLVVFARPGAPLYGSSPGSSTRLKCPDHLAKSRRRHGKGIQMDFLDEC